MGNAVNAMPAELEAGWRTMGLWQDVSLAEAMGRAACERPDAPLHFFGASGERVTTLGAVHAEGLRLAGAFHALGLRPGDTIAMQLPNGLENAVLFQAAVAIHRALGWEPFLVAVILVLALAGFGLRGMLRLEAG